MRVIYYTLSMFLLSGCAGVHLDRVQEGTLKGKLIVSADRRRRSADYVGDNEDDNAGSETRSCRTTDALRHVRSGKVTNCKGNEGNCSPPPRGFDEEKLPKAKIRYVIEFP